MTTSDKPGSEALREDDLHEIGSRVAHATPGPWRVVSHYDSGACVADIRSSDRILCVEAGACVMCHVEGERANTFDNGLHNAAFVAHAREDVSRLLGEVLANRKALREAVRAIAEANLLITGHMLGKDRDEASKLRRALRDLLMSRDVSWEEDGGGHDWREAVDDARAALGDPLV